MARFIVLIAFYDGGNRFRERNVLAVIDHWVNRMPECDICISEQISGASTLFTTEVLEKYGNRVKYIATDLGNVFRKPTLLNVAVNANPNYDAYIMGDADALPDENCIDFIRKNWTIGSLVYPFAETIYMKEYDTVRFIQGLPLLPGVKDHGVHVARQTGLCNVFTYDTFTKVGGFDDDFCRWGAEDDAFLVKCARLVGPIARNKCAGTVYHMFHPVVNTPDYIESAAYIDNRKRCACIRRMSDDDLHKYVSKEVSLKDMIKKYEASKRLDVRLEWKCTPQSVLRIDTTIYDIDRNGEMSFSKILDEVLKEDGAAYAIEFIDGILLPIIGLSRDQLEEIYNYRKKLCSLVEISEKT